MDFFRTNEIYKNAISNNNSNLIVSFNSKKGFIHREINKEIPSEPEKFEDKPENLLGFKTKENKPFLLHKEKYLIIL